MELQQRVFKTVVAINWFLLVAFSVPAHFMTPTLFARGVFLGALIVTVNFHFLHLSLKKGFQKPRELSFQRILFRHYLQLVGLVILIFLLVSRGIVDPVGLLIGVSVVVISLMTVAVVECARLLRIGK